MTKWVIGLLAAAVLALPATAFGDTGGQSQTKSPAQQCRAERSANADGFKAKYRTFGKCVSQKAKEQAAGDDSGTDHSNAADLCRAERSKDAAAFKDKWGTNHNKSNAFGKCVSSTAHQLNKSDEDNDGNGKSDDSHGQSGDDHGQSGDDHGKSGEAHGPPTS